ncbi:MAG: dephospho-CoA kinase [Pseudomonadota bacterium]
MTKQSGSNTPMMLGLTGSIGMGKSTVAAMFEEAGVPVFDADAAVRAMQGPDGELIPAIEAAFPGATGPQGVNREKLGEMVFGDRDKLSALEAIVHPAVAQKRAQFLSDNAEASMLLFDIPLLFERGSEVGFDAVIVVSAPAEMQRERVLSRPGMTREKFEHILSLQVPDAQKREKADHIIDTSTSLAETKQQVAELVEHLRMKGST